MDTVFNINRFLNLEKRNIFLSRTQYLYILGALIGLYILSMLLQILTGSNFCDLIFFIAYVAIVGGPCFFEKSMNKHASVFDFVLPPSSFEKFMSIWLKYVLLIPGMIFLAIFLLNVITGLIPIEAVQAHATAMSFSDNLRFSFFHKLLGFQSVFILGYFFFKKYAFAKTSLILLLVFVILMFLGVIVGYILFKGQEFGFNANMGETESFNMGYTLGRSMNDLRIEDDTIINTCSAIMSAIFPLGIWIVCYFKLKETEI